MKNLFLIMHKVFLLSLLALLVTACASPRQYSHTKFSTDIPKELALNIQKETGVNFGFIALIDSKTGEKKYLKHPDAEVGIASGSEDASEIKNIASISVTNVDGIKINDRILNNSQYINIDGKIILATAAEGHEKNRSHLKRFNEISTIPTNLINELEKVAGIMNGGNTNFITLVDIVTGQAKLFVNETSNAFVAELPQSISKINSGNAWNITTYKKNPCCQLIFTGGDAERICKRICY